MVNEFDVSSSERDIWVLNFFILFFFERKEEKKKKEKGN